MTVQLTTALEAGLKVNKIRAIDFIQFMIDEHGAKTEKPIEETATKDLTIDGKPIIKVVFDRLLGQAQITLGEKQN